MRRRDILLPLVAFLFTASTACSGGSSNSTAPAGDKGTLAIEAQIIYTTGGPQPVARDTFYLLDSDFLLNVKVPDMKGVRSLEEATKKMSPAENLKFTLDIAQANKKLQEVARERGVTLPNQQTDKEGSVMSIKLIIEEWMMKNKDYAPHFIQTATTDFQGRATFENIKSGDYWIMGVTETRADFAFWNQKVSIKPGENKVFLSQENALYFK